MQIFYKRDSKCNVREIRIQLVEIDSEHYRIIGESGLLGGKMTPRPVITITESKVKRTVKEQAELQYNSMISDFLDKGYKSEESLGIENSTDLLEVNTKVPKEVVDNKGIRKPMLAKSYEDVKPEVLEKEWGASRKLDGVRSLMYWDSNSCEIKTSSRGGKDYNIPSTEIRNEPILRVFFQENPNIVLDGELYIHGKPLSEISGMCRLIEYDKSRLDRLAYHIYDIVDETLTFRERLEILDKLKKSLWLSHFGTCWRVHVVEHEKVTGFENIMKLHNKYVTEGYEGVVVRDPDQKYKCNARDTRMIKVKKFLEREDKIVDLVNGLRDEDLCFLMETKEGYNYKAKPRGDRELKKWYRENIESLKGTMGTIRYFGLTTTDKPVPNLPIFVNARSNKDI